MSWSALFIGPLLMVLLFGCWLGVQQLWRRAFGLAEQTDTLAGRESCANCSCATDCYSPDKQRLPTEASHDR
jgi:hypothetical protein